jgi:menaquinone-dependent protoporphyrinogen oxidase
MSRLLVVYGTTDGHTRKIAHYMAHVARGHGHQVEVMDATLHPGPEGFDAVIVAASVHQLRHQASVMHFVDEHRHLLNEQPSAFFSVSLSAALPEPQHQVEARECAEELLAETRWRPVMVRLVAGALLYTQYDFLKRLLMQLIARHDGSGTDTSRDYEYTDWERLKTDVEEFLALVEAPVAGVQPAAASEPAGTAAVA